MTIEKKCNKPIMRVIIIFATKAIMNKPKQKLNKVQLLRWTEALTLREINRKKHYESNLTYKTSISGKKGVE